MTLLALYDSLLVEALASHVTRRSRRPVTRHYSCVQLRVALLQNISFLLAESEASKRGVCRFIVARQVNLPLPEGGYQLLFERPSAFSGGHSVHSMVACGATQGLLGLVAFKAPVDVC